MEAVTYSGDTVGASTADARTTRRGQTVESLKNMSGFSSIETVFKNGLSVFDDLERVVVYAAAEQKRLIDELKKLGYAKWPDGRALADVIQVVK